MENGKWKSWIRVAVIFAALVLMVLLFNSCASQKVITEEPMVPTQDTLSVWEQKFRKNIEVKDSVRFYNSTEIRIEKSFFDEFNFVEDGVIYSTDSIIDVLRTVPIKTSALSIKLEKDKLGVLNTMVVSFSRSEITYILTFFRIGSVKTSGKTETVKNQTQNQKGNVKVSSGMVNAKNPNSFVLGGKATIIFRGHPYKDVPITTIGKEDCLLLVDYRKSKVRIKDENSAEGL